MRLFLFQTNILPNR